MRPWRVISSWWVTAALLVAFAGAYVAFAFGENPYERWVRFLLGNAWGLALYVALMLNLALASIRALAGKGGSPDVSEAAIRDMDEYAEVEASEDWASEVLRSIARKAGLDALLDKRGGCIRKGRLSVLPGTVLRAGVVLLMAAVLLSAHLRRSEEAVLHPSGHATLLGADLTLESVDAGLKEDFLEVGETGAFKVESVRAALDASGRRFTASGGRAEKVSGRYYRIVHLGYNQPFSFDGISGSADLDVLPPGRLHATKIDGDEGVLSFAIEPERTIRKGLLTGRVYNLKSPLMKVTYKGSSSGEAVLKPGEEKTLGGHALSLGEALLFIRVRAVRDPAMPLLYWSGGMVLAGLLMMLLRFFWYERRLCFLYADGRLLMGYSEEFYGKWGVLKFRSWAEEFLPERGVDLPAGK